MFPFLIITLSLVPNFIWLKFYLKQDPHPEPKRLIMAAFFLGGLSTVLALAGGTAILHLADFFSTQSQAEIQNSLWFMFVGVALIEELAKFLIAFLLLRRNQNFDEPIDAMIYLAVIALGFAFVENIVYLASIFSQFKGELSQVVYFVALRFIGANFLHTLSSGLLGYFWALGVVKEKFWTYIFFGLILASLVHGSFNAVIVILGMPFYTLAIICLFVVGIFVLRDAELLRHLKLKDKSKSLVTEK